MSTGPSSRVDMKIGPGELTSIVPQAPVAPQHTFSGHSFPTGSAYLPHSAFALHPDLQTASPQKESSKPHCDEDLAFQRPMRPGQKENISSHVLAVATCFYCAWNVFSALARRECRRSGHEPWCEYGSIVHTRATIVCVGSPDSNQENENEKS